MQSVTRSRVEAGEPMSVTIQTTAPVSNGGMPPGGPPPGMRQAMDALADKLGMGADELGGRLKNGESLAQIAGSKGVSRDDAIAALSSAMKANAPQGVSLSDDRANAIATRIFDGKAPDPPPSQGLPATGGMSRLAGAFGEGQQGQDILSRLMSGEDVSSVAKSAGLTSSDLVSLMASRLRVDDRA